MITQCCDCQKIRHDEQWVQASPLDYSDTAISHGYCPTCAAKAMLTVDQYRYNTDAASVTDLE